MPRPAPEILLRHQAPLQDVEVVPATRLWTVLYRGRPCAVRNRQHTASGEFIKYPKMTFPTRKVAENLAKKLNDLFMTKDFTVAGMTYENTGTTRT